MALRFSEARPIFCAVLDGAALGPDPRDSALALFAAGVDWIQLRDRSLEANALLRLARALVAAREAAGNTSTLRGVLVNRRIDVALAAAADGVHLGFDALGAGSAAALLPETSLVGSSAHSLREVESLAAGRTDSGVTHYAHLAPIWNPLSKPASRPALGPELLEEACSLELPILAQGGIDAAHAAEAIRAGAAGIAVTGILADKGNRIAIARQLRAALDESISPTGGTR